MAVTVSFWSTKTLERINPGSGIAFFGNTAGSSVSVGSYASRNFIANSGGSVTSSEMNSNQWVSATGVNVNGSGAISLINLPNQDSVLTIKAISDGGNIQVQNARVRITSRAGIAENPTGVLCKVARIWHVGPSQLVAGSGDSTWLTPSGSSAIVSLPDSPGISGAYAIASGSTRADTEHWWFLAISASPSTVGSKYFQLFTELEYL